MSGFNRKPFKPVSDKPFTKTHPTRTGTTGSTSSTPTLPDLNWLQNPNLPDGQSVDLDSAGGYSDVASLFSSFLNSSGMTNIDLSSLGGLASILQQYLINKDLHSAERNDLFLQYILQWLNNNDQRAFDLKQLQDSRLYNSPTNELARMLGAGISRDAAIQMLSGSAGNVSGVAGSMGAAAPSMPATSGTMDLQQKQFAVGTVQSAVAMLGQLIDSGLSLAQGVESVKAMQGANFFSQAQMQGFSSANEFVNMLQAKIAAGEIDSAEVEKLSNGKDLVKYLQKIAPDNASAAELLNSNAYKGTFGSIYGRQFYNDFWDSVRKTRDSGTLADEFIIQQRLNNAFTSANIEKVGAEMELIGSQMDEIEQRIIESVHNVAKIDAEIEVLNANGEWIKVQTANYGRYIDSVINQNDASAFAATAQGEFAGAQTVGQNIQNDINRDIFEINHAGFPMMKEAHLQECEHELARLRFINRPSERVKELTAWSKDRDNAVKLAYLNELYYNAAGKFASQYPNLWNLCVGFNAAGAGDVVRTANSAANGASVGAAAKFIKYIPK